MLTRIKKWLKSSPDIVLGSGGVPPRLIRFGTPEQKQQMIQATLKHNGRKQRRKIAPEDPEDNTYGNHHCPGTYSRGPGGVMPVSYHHDHTHYAFDHPRPIPEFNDWPRGRLVDDDMRRKIAARHGHEFADTCKALVVTYTVADNDPLVRRSVMPPEWLLTPGTTYAADRFLASDGRVHTRVCIYTTY